MQRSTTDLIYHFQIYGNAIEKHATRTKKVYQLVPQQDFSKPWSDEELYAKYELSDEEIDFIESMIKPMNFNGGDNDA